MAEILSLQGRDVFAWARASIKDGLEKLAERKGVELNPALREILADDVLGRMKFTSIYEVARQDQDSLIAAMREANAALDAVVLARMWKLIAFFEGKTDMLDPDVCQTARNVDPHRRPKVTPLSGERAGY